MCDALPEEPIVALDDAQSEEALLHPLDAAVSTIVQVTRPRGGDAWWRGQHGGPNVAAAVQPPPVPT